MRLHVPLMKHAVLVTAFAVLYAAFPHAMASAQDYIRFQNRWKPDQHLHVEYGRLQSGRIKQGWHSAIWVMERVGPYVRFRNLWKPDRYLHIERGWLAAGPIKRRWHSAMWIIEPARGPFVRIRNRWRGNQYLHIEYGNIKTGPIRDGWYSAMWRLQPVQWSRPQPPTLRPQPPGFRPPQPQAALCRGEVQYRSLASVEKASLQFRNRSRSTQDSYRIYWLDFRGRRKFYRHIYPGDTFNANTFLSHPWVVTAPVRGGGEDCINVYWPTRGNRVIVLR